MKAGNVMLLLAIGLVAIAALSLVYSSSLSYGTVEGTVTIGPWTPVEPVGGSHPPPEVYTSRRVILEGSFLPRVEIPTNGTGYFRAHMRTWTYSATISNCTYIGCSLAKHQTVIVNPSHTTTI
jgi:hypothetical protein